MWSTVRQTESQTQTRMTAILTRLPSARVITLQRAKPVRDFQCEITADIPEWESALCECFLSSLTCHVYYYNLQPRWQNFLTSQTNNQTLNRSKSLEIVFTAKRRKRDIHLPSPIPNISRVTSIKILGVTISNSLSVCEHVSNTTASCAQSVHALRILRSHGLLDDSVYDSTSSTERL